MRATVGKCMMDSRRRPRAGAAAGANARVDRRERRRCGALGRRRATAGCAPRSRRASRCRARASCSRRSRRSPASNACSSTRTRPNRRTRSRSCDASRAGSPTSSTWPTPASRRDRLCAAHCVWVDDAEQALLAERDVKVLHCPGSNLKLGSGIAPVVEMRARGISRVARRRRRGLQQPARHVRRDAARRHAPGGPSRTGRAARARRRCGWRRAAARGRSGWRQRSDRSSPASAPT